MKWPFLLPLLLVAAVPAAVLVSTMPTPAQETRIAAVVNDDIVSVDDVAARLQLTLRSSSLPDTPENRQRLAPRVLRTLIDEKLEMQEAKRVGVTASQDEINTMLSSIETRNNMPKGGLDAYLKQAGIPRSSLVSQITASVTWGKLARGRLAQDITVSDEEVNETMTQMKQDIGKPQEHAAEIFLAVDNPSQEDEVKRLADRLIEQIRAGANFSAVAQQFSQAPSAAVGGDIGWVTASELSPVLGEAISKMNPGEMSYPVRTPAGFYVLYLMERKTLGATDANEALLSIDEIVFPLAATATPEERQRITAAADALSSTAKSCGEMTKYAQDHANDVKPQVGQTRAGDLPVNLKGPVLALKIAEASKPLPVTGGLGIVMVCQRQDAKGLPTRDEVQDNLARERLDALARRYLRDLRRSAYVDIRG